MPARPIRVLFLCDDNTSRSQIAEGWLRRLGGDRFVSRSAGVAPSHLHPLATRAMQESDVDIARQRGKGLEAVSLERFDVVVTLSDGARVGLTRLSGTFEHEHEEVSDPSWLEGDDGPDLDEFRAVRDALLKFVERLVERYA